MARRSLQFWRIARVNGEDLTRPFPARRLAEVLLSAERRGVDRRLSSPDGSVVMAHARAVAPIPVVLLDRVRESNFPSVGDSAGQRKALPLAPGDHLLETTYFGFLKRNVLAVLTSANGPRASRLCEYLEGMFGLGVELVPVLREDVDQILARLQVSKFEFAVPAGKLNDGAQGEWAEVLGSASRLMTQGTFRMSLSVGRSGNATEKQRVRERIQQLIEQFRRSATLEQFDYAVAEGRDSVSGDREIVDLLKDRFIARVEVAADVVNDPQKSTEEAISIFARQSADHDGYFAQCLPAVKGLPEASWVPDLVGYGSSSAPEPRGERPATVLSLRTTEEGVHGELLRR
ncbi:hypothetical protein [Arthrobacter sp. M4]|uniref:hypothetical protein n=1 Tax=Arthrobacter sp. M4 TaxID=218160 RepID=UPI001CDC0ECC|nr:hypothetical protein [Arthrobacter sp. M4]MCA4135677.1 hypothetical protein [Arthrobacter sp. M4]